MPIWDSGRLKPGDRQRFEKRRIEIRARLIARGWDPRTPKFQTVLRQKMGGH
jgi:hypothetical protein